MRPALPAMPASCHMEVAKHAQQADLLVTVTLTIWKVSPRSTCQYWAPWLKVVAQLLASLLLLPSTARLDASCPSVELCTVSLPALSRAGASALPAPAVS